MVKDVVKYTEQSPEEDDDYFYYEFAVTITSSISNLIRGQKVNENIDLFNIYNPKTRTTCVYESLAFILTIDHEYINRYSYVKEHTKRLH